MSTKFEQLLDYLVNEEMEKANELFHEIVVEKSREIYENLISEEEEDDEEMDEAREEDDEEMDESAEEDDEEMDESADDEEADESVELEDSYMMDAEDDGFGGGEPGDATDELGAEIGAGDEGEEKSEDEAIMDIKNAIAELEAAFADLEAAQGGEMDGDMDADAEFGDEDDEDEEATDEMMGQPAFEGKRITREYREKVGNDWDKNSQKTPGPVGSGKGELAGQTSVDGGKSPVSSGKGKPTTGATAGNILGDQKTGEGTNVGTKPTGKAGGLVGNVKGEFTKGVEKNIAGSSTASMKDGAALNKQGSGYPSNNKNPGPVGSGTGDKAGQTSIDPATKKQFLPQHTK